MVDMMICDFVVVDGGVTDAVDFTNFSLKILERRIANFTTP